jgi:hypothetical protein
VERICTRESPFQLPAGLADGLGLESGLEISCLTSFAPSPIAREIWVSRIRFQEESRISAATAKLKQIRAVLSICRQNRKKTLPKYFLQRLIGERKNELEKSHRRQRLVVDCNAAVRDGN